MQRPSALLSERQNALKSLILAWDKYVQNYIARNLGEKEFGRVMKRYFDANTEYDKGAFAIQARLLQLETKATREGQSLNLNLSQQLSLSSAN